MIFDNIFKTYKIFLAVQGVDFRKGIDGLSALCTPIFESHPLQKKHIFIFRNKKNKACKILFYDKQGGWLFLRRLSHGKFLWWPKSKQHSHFECSLQQLVDILFNHMPEGFTD